MTLDNQNYQYSGVFRGSRSCPLPLSRKNQICWKYLVRILSNTEHPCSVLHGMIILDPERALQLSSHIYDPTVVMLFQGFGLVVWGSGSEQEGLVVAMVTRVCSTSGNGSTRMEELMERYQGSRRSYLENRTSQFHAHNLWYKSWWLHGYLYSGTDGRRLLKPYSVPHQLPCRNNYTLNTGYTAGSLFWQRNSIKLCQLVFLCRPYLMQRYLLLCLNVWQVEKDGLRYPIVWRAMFIISRTSWRSIEDFIKINTPPFTFCRPSIADLHSSDRPLRRCTSNVTCRLSPNNKYPSLPWNRVNDG